MPFGRLHADLIRCLLKRDGDVSAGFQ